MTLVHKSTPKQKIVVTHSGTDYELQGESLTTDVLQVENGVWQAIVQANDYKGATFLNKADHDDVVKIYMDYTGSWNQQVFGGWINKLTPSLTSEMGETVYIEARGYGLAFLAMRVAEEYGTQSRNPTKNTINEVLTDASVGIIPKWVHKVLNTATDSGYSIDTSKLVAIDSDFRFFYWPYTPVLKAMDDMLDYIRARNAEKPEAGVHWIIYPDGTTAYLCLATIGSHENPPADIWPTRYAELELTQYTDKTSCEAAGHYWANSKCWGAIEVKKDMIVSAFVKNPHEGNYVLYHGKLKKPSDEIWTENKASSWGTNDAPNITLLDDNTDYKVGSYSLQATLAQLRQPSNRWYYPSGQNLALDVTKMGGEYNIPTINFYAMYPSANPISSEWWIFLQTSSGNEFKYDLYSLLTADKWRPVSLPIGLYANQAEASDMVWKENGTGDWTNINSIEFGAKVGAGTTAHCHIDGLQFFGWVLRGARDDTKIGTQKAEILLRTDDVGKDDTLTSGTPGTTDVGTMGRLAKAELYRAIGTPITGQIVIPGKETILPGQLCHIHFGKKSDGSFNIDTDMRVLTHRLHFGIDGFKSFLTLTDDILNSRARNPTDRYNVLLKAVAPGFQDRERGSQKAREIDITQVILSENYST